MKFESEIVYRMPMSLDEWHIRGFFETLNIKEFYRKGVKGMLNIEKIESWGANLYATRDENRAIKLANKEAIVKERVAEFERKLRETIDDELIAEADAPTAHDIELFEQFKNAEVLDENAEVEGEC